MKSNVTRSQEDGAAVAELDRSGSMRVELVDGKDLFWYGTRVAAAIGRLSARFERLRSISFGVQPNN